jgi:hypothetical protein
MFYGIEKSFAKWIFLGQFWLLLGKFIKKEQNSFEIVEILVTFSNFQNSATLVPS